MGHGTTDDAALGRVLAGRYRLSAVIGHGGMARIYRATDQVLDRPVAVKVLDPERACDERLLARFQSEAKVGASFAHPDVVEIYDAGCDDGRHFIAMELVRGRTLEDLLGERRALPPDRTVEIASRVCTVLAAAHEHGVVHGDVKPANIILTRSGQVKMIDFGNTMAGAGLGLSTGVILATRAYCSPEQAMGEPVDPRSDIYSLGVVLHRMLTGELPAGPGTPGVPRLREREPGPPDPNRAAELSLRAVVERAIATDPADRQQTARELRAELAEAMRESALAISDPSEYGAADPARTRQDGHTKPLPAEATRTSDPPTPRTSHPLSVRLAAINVLVVAAALMVVTGLILTIIRANLSAEPRRRLEAVARSFEQGPARNVTGPDGLRAEARNWLAAQPSPGDQVVAVRTDQGDVLTSTGGLDLLAVPQAATLLRSRESRWWSLPEADTRLLGLTVPLVRNGRQVGTLVAVAGQTQSDATWNTLLSTVAIASAVGLAFAGLLAFATMRRTLRPLSRISHQADAIQTEDDLSRRIGEDGTRDEVGRLAAAFNRMLTRLESTVRSQRRFVADASHELRTPLTVAKGQLELATGEIGQARARQALSLVDTELDRMGRIVQELLLLTQLDEGLPLARESVEVELVLQEALLRGLRGARRKTTVETYPDVYVLADRDRLLQVLSNLVTNAVQHAGEDARIRLRAGHQDGQVAIEVRDDGRGIPPQDLPHIFDRFHRSKAEPGGAGLGLAIAASITRAMDGRISVKSERGHGTTFTVLLPSA